MCQVNIHFNWKMSKRYYIFEVTYSLKETLGIIFVNVLCYTICLTLTFPFLSCEYIFPNILDHNLISHKNPSDYREERADFSPNTYENEIDFIVISVAVFHSCSMEQLCWKTRTCKGGFVGKVVHLSLKLYSKISSIKIFSVNIAKFFRQAFFTENFGVTVFVISFPKS